MRLPPGKVGHLSAGAAWPVAVESAACPHPGFTAVHNKSLGFVLGVHGNTWPPLFLLGGGVSGTSGSCYFHLASGQEVNPQQLCSQNDAKLQLLWAHVLVRCHVGSLSGAISLCNL